MSSASLTRPHDGVAVVTLDATDRGGFMSWDAVDALADAMAEGREGGARVTVLASAADEYWFQHAWLPDLIAMAEGKPTSAEADAWWRALAEIAHVDVVTIAAINGDCSGGGAEFGWACDLRVASENAWFGQPEVQIALATGIGGTSRLARLIGRTATAGMVFDGGPVTAARIYELGGLNRLVPEGAALEIAVAWAARLAQRPHASLVAEKQMLNDNDDMTLHDALRNEQRLFGGTVSRSEGIARMKATQARFDAGETVRQVYGDPGSVGLS
jgi:enoyl-CoA hydratase/carnithine racemase